MQLVGVILLGVVLIVGVVILSRATVKTRTKAGPDQATSGNERFFNEPWLSGFERRAPQSGREADRVADPDRPNLGADS